MMKRSSNYSYIEKQSIKSQMMPRALTYHYPSSITLEWYPEMWDEMYGIDQQIQAIEMRLTNG